MFPYLKYCISISLTVALLALTGIGQSKLPPGPDTLTSETTTSNIRNHTIKPHSEQRKNDFQRFQNFLQYSFITAIVAFLLNAFKDTWMSWRRRSNLIALISSTSIGIVQNQYLLSKNLKHQKGDIIYPVNGLDASSLQERFQDDYLGIKRKTTESFESLLLNEKNMQIMLIQEGAEYIEKGNICWLLLPEKKRDIFIEHVKNSVTISMDWVRNSELAFDLKEPDNGNPEK